MWTKKIVELISNGKTDAMYHFFSTIIFSLSSFILIDDSTIYSVVLSPLIGFLIMLMWELAQWKWDSGFSRDDIISNLKGAFFSLLMLTIMKTIINLI